MRKGDDTMRMKMMAGAALCASTLAFAAPVAATVVPGDTFQVAVVGFNQAEIANDPNVVDGLFLAGPLEVTFGTTQDFLEEGFDDQTVTVTSSETIGATMTTDTVSIFLPTNFLPDDGTTTPNGFVIDQIEFDLGSGNAGTNGLDFLLPIGVTSFTGSVQFGSSMASTQPVIVLSGGNTRLAFAEAASVASGTSISSAAVNRFDFSITYANVIASAIPEPGSWALMIAGFGAVGYAMRRAVRRSEARFDDRIRRITAGEIA